MVSCTVGVALEQLLKCCLQETSGRYNADFQVAVSKVKGSEMVERVGWQIPSHFKQTVRTHADT